MTQRLHFICRGNVFRSRLAEAYAKSLGLNAISSGTVAEKYREENRETEQNVKNLLTKQGWVDFWASEPHQLSQGRIAPGDRLVIMDASIVDEVPGYIELPANYKVLSIADWKEGGAIEKQSTDIFDFFERSFAEIKLQLHEQRIV